MAHHAWAIRRLPGLHSCRRRDCTRLGMVSGASAQAMCNAQAVHNRFVSDRIRLQIPDPEPLGTIAETIVFRFPQEFERHARVGFWNCQDIAFCKREWIRARKTSARSMTVVLSGLPASPVATHV